MSRLRIDALLFDLDGTLIDESESYREVIRLTAEFLLRSPVGSEEVDAVKQIPGLNNDWDATWVLVGMRLHGMIVPPDAADRGSQSYRRLRDVFQTYYLGDRLWRQLSGRQTPFPWAEPLMWRETPLIEPDTLAWLAHGVSGIATSRPRVEALMVLHQHSLDSVFRDGSVIAAEDAPFEKPHPAPLLALAHRLGCRRPVYVGDTINDAIAACEAEMQFILVGSEPLDDAAINRHIHARIASVNDLPSAVEL